MTIYLSSFYPLCCTVKGQISIEKYNLPAYIDGSCRREPDFENSVPCITGLCRPGFSEKLCKGDIIIYLTNKRGIGAKKLVAIFIVVDKCDNHRLAYEWYSERSLAIPNNLMVGETSPYPLDKTHQMGGLVG